MNESEKEENSKVSYVDRSTFGILNRPWLMPILIAIFICILIIVFGYGLPESILELFILQVVKRSLKAQKRSRHFS